MMKYFFFLKCLVWLVLGGLSSCQPGSQNPTDYSQWTYFRGKPDNSHYSSLSQITKANVSQLKIAWVYHSENNQAPASSQIQCTPIILEGILYGISPTKKLFALDASTGKKVWLFDPKLDSDDEYTSLAINRGVSYWKDPNGKETARILYARDNFLYAIDAKSGKVIETFGQKGRINLAEGLGRNPEEIFIAATSPGAVYKDMIIMGSRVSESDGAAPGFIRAFDVRTGKQRWVFHTIPQPGEYGYETWPKDAYKYAGGVNAWSGFSLDEEEGILYAPLGSASFDFYGANRKGTNLFANCILALDAETGKLKWHFQTVHHDIWDRDLPCPPNLITVKQNGKTIKALAQVTKTGFVFLLDRITGEPLFPVEEKPFPQKALPGEEPWPTQPIPSKPKPLVRQTMSKDELTNLSPEKNKAAWDRLRTTRYGGLFIPPSEQGTVIFPGFDGGGEWGGAAADPNTGILYVNANEMAWILEMVKIQDESGVISMGKGLYLKNCVSCHGLDKKGSGDIPSLEGIQDKYPFETIAQTVKQGKGRMPGFKQLSHGNIRQILDFITGKDNPADQQAKTVSYAQSAYVNTGYNRFLDDEGYPAVRPPWGTLNAIDMNTGEYLWTVPLGELEELTKKGIPQTGTENYGGPALTAGGLIFIGASKDEKFRAFDKDTGKVLWETKLPAGAYATPSVYEANGKQYIVVACGGGKMGTKSGDAYVAFSLK
ncbi:MAG: PQQ-binding-like beta-propeller repeat protein [Microscillaceae bacterium]|nr:PQQ-binding-like beta-propeller repeat protein [Microscillaceae bacterium]